MLTPNDYAVRGENLLNVFVKALTLREGLKKGPDVNESTKFAGNFTPDGV
jgi:hypothetical protein